MADKPHVHQWGGWNQWTSTCGQYDTESREQHQWITGENKKIICSRCGRNR
jgi:hypothetical protein